MKNNELFASSYNFDKKYIIPDVKVEKNTEGAIQTKFDGKWQFILRPEVFNNFPEIDDNSLKNLYGFPVDEYTDEDFKEFIEYHRYTIKELLQFTNNYQVSLKRKVDTQLAIKNLKTQRRLRTSWDYTLERLFDRFYSIQKKRDFRILRLIEINEFIENGLEDQKFEEFLTDNKKLESKIKDLKYEKYSNYSTDILSDHLPDFLTNKKELNLAARKVLLELTKSDFKNIYDYPNLSIMHWNNKGRSSKSAESINSYLDVIFERNKDDLISDKDAIDYVFNNIYSDASGLEELAETLNVTKFQMLAKVAESLMKWKVPDTPEGLALRRFVTILEGNDSFKGLDLVDKIALAGGCIDTSSWSRDSANVYSLDVLCNKIENEEISLNNAITLIVDTVKDPKANRITISNNKKLDLMTDMPLFWMSSFLSSHPKPRHYTVNRVIRSLYYMK